MKIIDLNEIKLGKAYLYGNVCGRPEAIVWPMLKHFDEEDERKDTFSGRILTTEKSSDLNAFFSLSSFVGPDEHHCFLKELTDDEVDLVKQKITLKLDKCFRFKDTLYLDAGFEGEARKFANDLFADICPPLVAGREIWAPATPRPREE